MSLPIEVYNTIWYVCLYALMAVPLTLSYRISKVLNFAHGVYITLGAYTSVLVGVGLRAKLLPVLAVPLAFLVGASIAVATDRLVFSPLIRRTSNPVTLMIASMGAWIFIKYAFYAVIDTVQKMLSTSLFYTTPNLDLPEKMNLMGTEIDMKFLFVVSLTIATFSLLAFFLTRTKLGLALRAIADNPSLSQISGISKDKAMFVTWLISGGIAALAGFSWSLFAYVSPETGDIVILQIFASSVIGGLVSLPLTFVGSAVISSAENLLIIVLNRFLGVELSFRPFLSFLVLVLVILIRPPLGAGGGLPYRYRLKGLFRRR